MRKLGIIVIVCLLALAGITAAMAYTNATVTNPATLAVVNTNNALLSLEPGTGPGNADANAYINANGELEFDFRKGLAKYGNMGFQGNSVYEWERLFWIHNKSGEAVNVLIESDLPYVEIGFEEYAPGTESKNQWWHWKGKSFFSKGNAQSFGPDTRAPILVRFTIPEGAKNNQTWPFEGSIVVNASVN